MELVLALAIGVLMASGVWLILRPRTFGGNRPVADFLCRQSLHFSMGRLRTNAAPVLDSGVDVQAAQYTDPVPQALVLTAIVIGFAMTALFLVVLLASRGLTRTDHVDGKEN